MCIIELRAVFVCTVTLIICDFYFLESHRFVTRQSAYSHSIFICPARNAHSRSETARSGAVASTYPVAAVPSLAWIEAERSDKALAIMFLSYSSERRWRHMATVEVGCHVTNFAQLIQDDTLEFQVEPAGKSPPGVQWFLLFMDFSAGERRAARTTWAVLTALKRSADDGFIVGFRVVYGRHWLSLGSSSDTGEHATSRNVPAARMQSLEYPSEEGMACAR